MRALLLLASAIAPIAFRFALGWELDKGFAVQDLRGVLSDVGVSLAVVLLLFAAAKISRWLVVALISAFALANYANYENVRALGALAQIRDAAYLADPTFLLGSALVISSPVTLGLVLIASGALAWWGARGARTRSPWLATAALALVAFALVWLWPDSDQFADWRQINFVQANAAHAGEDLDPSDPGGGLARFRDPPTAMLDRLPSLRADLDGVPRFDIRFEDRPRNVLLVVVESLSGAHIAPIAAQHGYVTPHRLSTLDRLAEGHLTATTFVAHNRKTNRGEYALLCGELPNLLPAEPKMAEHVAGAGWRRCLPQVLRDAGYATVYLQAAPLAFMLKDQFMPIAGFERVLGDADLETVRFRTHWGVDDLSLFEHSLEVLEELRADERPWFLTLLTAGTHHPYTVPRDFDLRRDDPAARALAYADMALGKFMSQLEQRGILGETLVLITSDESMGLAARDEPNPLMGALAQNWGVLIAIVPGEGPSLVTEPYGQMDVAISVLDYLDLSDAGSYFFGRSFFRRYATGRWMFYANTNQLTTGAFDPFRRIVRCRVGDSLCRKFSAEAGKVFGARRQPVGLDPADSIVQDMALRSIRHAPRSTERLTLQLVADTETTLAPGARTVLFGGQYLDLREDEWLEFDLVLEARGAAGSVRLVHYTKQTRSWAADRAPGPGRMLVERESELAVGQRLTLRYRIAPNGGMQGIQSRATAQNTGTEPIELVFARATMTKRSSGERPATEITIVADEIAPFAER